jgi:hypothetical protein
MVAAQRPSEAPPRTHGLDTEIQHNKCMDIGQNNNYTTDRHTTNIKTNVFNKNIKTCFISQFKTIFEQLLHGYYFFEGGKWGVWITFHNEKKAVSRFTCLKKNSFTEN